MKRFAILAVFVAAACGNAEIIAPAPLSVVDSYPGQGALVPAGDVAMALTFSEPIVAASIDDGIGLRQTTTTGATVREIPIALGEYDADIFTATFDVEPLPADATFELTATAAGITAESGAVLPFDVVRRFRTAP